MSSLPSEFLLLPNHFDGGNWLESVVRAHSIISTAYHHASKAFHASKSDAHCLQLYSEKLINQMIPIFKAMEPEVLNHEWVKSAAESIANLYLELEGAALAVDNVYVQQLA